MLAAKVIHLIKCISVEVKIRQDNKCYRELPVIYQNKSFYLAPKIRIILKEASPSDFNEFLLNMYNLHGTWYRVTRKLIESVPSLIIQLLTKPRWKYIDPEPLGTSGICFNDDHNKLRLHIKERIEKLAIFDNLARAVNGR